jgi:thiopurine S-methyltransferase
MSDPVKPTQQRPEHPDFWDQRFQNGVTPWDAGGVPATLQAFAAQQAAARRVLIPGCGSAHDAAFLDRLGWPVVALDFSAAAIEVAQQNLGAWGGELVHDDFFTHQPLEAYDLIYERAFLCALPRKLWPGYGQRMAELLAPGGLLAGFFLFGDELKGPPFPIQRPQLDELLTPYFNLLTEQPVSDSLPVFAGRESWLVWQRRD